MRTLDADPAAADLVADTEVGARHPGGITGRLLFTIALCWALFQLWYASPLQLQFGGLNDFEARSIHLAFALFLAYAAFPAGKRSARDRVPLIDWLLGLTAAFCAGYIVLNYDALAERSGVPSAWNPDLMVALVGLLLLLEAARRALGPALAIIATIMLVYTLAGSYMPDVIAHDGKSLFKVLTHQWLTQEGVFGVPLGVSTDFVFLFVLFGAMLARAGAGNWFIQVAFALLGHMRGGPAKAAVVASAATGIVSGSSIANVATTGVYTIPLMKRVGFPAYKAGAVEVAASTNGQLMPPVMGAAAFVMIEYVGISYLDVVRHALLPALISYIALVYIVHLEACKMGMQGIPRPHRGSLAQRLLSGSGIVIAVCLTALGVYYGLGWLKPAAGDQAFYLIALLLFTAYVGLLWLASRYPELPPDDPDQAAIALPVVGPTVKVGLYFLLPLMVLMWCLMIERLSAGLSAFWATLLMVFIVLTQRPLMARLRRSRGGRQSVSRSANAWQQGMAELIDSLVAGARSMVPIAVATAAAGIVVGTVTLTGIGQVMVELVETVSGGNLMAALLFTALICVVLGMGLPTTANYIVVSSLMAPVVVEMASANGVVVPLIAVHLFVFYFGILADDTPPVGLAAFVASAIARSDPIKTGIQGFKYDIRTAILPFLFIFNTQLLLIGIADWFELMLVVGGAIAAMLLFAAATQGYWLTRSRAWESALLLLVAFSLFRPEFWWDQLYHPVQRLAPSQLERVVTETAAGGTLRLVASGQNIDGDDVRKAVVLPLGRDGSARQRLAAAGIEVSGDGDERLIEYVAYDSPAARQQLEYGWAITEIRVAAERPSKYWVYLPTLGLLALAFLAQRRRLRVSERTA